MANILVFGASIAQGYYDKEGGWVDRLKRYFLEQEIIHKWEQSVNVFNLALSGNTTTNILFRIAKETPQRIWGKHEAIFVFEIGLNDSIIIKGKPKIPLGNFRKNLTLLVKFCKKYSNKIIFLGLTPVEEGKVTPMPWSPTEYWYNERIKNYDTVLKKFCKDNNLGHIELFERLNRLNLKNYLADGGHPNTKGHELIFETVKNFLEEKKYI